MPGLIDLGTKYFDRGLRLLFFPCNQFCSEEPGTAADIAAFYVGKHGLPASSPTVSNTRWHMLWPAALRRLLSAPGHASGCPSVRRSRPTGRLGRAGRPYRPCSRHRSLMERVDVNGPNTHAVYTFLRSAAARVPLEGRKGTPPSSGAIEWNFTKFVVGRDGQVLQRCGQGVKPPFFDEQLPAWLS